jgi:hypothetical protein
MENIMYKIAIPVLGLFLFCMPAFSADDMAGMDMSHETNDVYAPAMMQMHKAMGAVKPTGDADIDFVQGMIPHHQGAIDMAKIELEKGKDPEIKKLAQDIINAQEVEIKQMNDWLAKHKQSANPRNDVNRITQETGKMIDAAVASAIKTHKPLDTNALADKLKSSVNGVQNAHPNDTGSAIVIQVNDDTFITMATVNKDNSGKFEIKTPIPAS